MRCASLAVVGLVGFTLVASAGPNPADETFQRGRELMKQKKFAEACASFEQSEKLDPQFGTLFNLADCETELGKLVSAWNRFRELARNDPDTARRALSAELAANLARRLPKLVVNVTARPDGLVLKIDGVDSTTLVGTEIPIDLGNHDIVASAPSFVERRTTVVIEKEGKVVTTTIALDPIVQVTPTPPEPVPTVVAPREPPLPEAPVNLRRRYGKVGVIGGSVITTGGLVIGGLAWLEWRAAQTCPIASGFGPSGCEETRSHLAVFLGDVSTGVVIVGLIPVAVGAYLWSTSSASTVIVPQVGADHAGVAILGRF